MLVEKFLSCGKGKFYKKLLGEWSTLRVDKVHMQDEYKGALKSEMDLNKEILKGFDLVKLIVN